MAKHVIPINCCRVVSEQCLDCMRQAIEKAGLTISLETTLATRKQSIHWHVVRPGQTGVLEFTFDPVQSEMFLEFRDQRFQPWITEACALLAEPEC